MKTPCVPEKVSQPNKAGPISLRHDRLQPADTSAVTPEAFIAAQHNCGFWDQATRY